MNYDETITTQSVPSAEPAPALRMMAAPPMARQPAAPYDNDHPNCDVSPRGDKMPNMTREELDAAMAVIRHGEKARLESWAAITDIIDRQGHLNTEFGTPDQFFVATFGWGKGQASRYHLAYLYVKDYQLLHHLGEHHLRILRTGGVQQEDAIKILKSVPELPSVETLAQLVENFKHGGKIIKFPKDAENLSTQPLNAVCEDPSCDAEEDLTPDQAMDIIDGTPADDIDCERLRKLARRKKKQKDNNDRLRNLPAPNPEQLAPPDVEIRFCDSLTLLKTVQAKQIDLGFCDPDWSKQADIDKFITAASEKMKILAIMAGNQNYLETLDTMRKHFPVIREIAYIMPGAGTIVDKLNILTCFKPIIVGSFDLERAFHNVVRSPAEAHSLHPWGLNLDGVQAVIERLSDPGALIADCYCGGGSVAIACVRTGRRFIGCDSGYAKDLVHGADSKLTWAEVATHRAAEEWEQIRNKLQRKAA